MARIQQIKHPDGDVIYPISHTNAIIDDSGNRLENVLQDLKQNSSIWNIELGSGVFVNRPDLLVDIKLGSEVWISSDDGIEISNSIKICTDIYIGSDVYIGTSPLDSNDGVYIGTNVYIASGFDSRNVEGGGSSNNDVWQVGIDSIYVNAANVNVALGTSVHIGSDSDVRIGKYSGIDIQTSNSEERIFIGTSVYIEPGFDTRNIFDNEGSAIEIVNDLTTGGTDKALSAEMGKVLQDNKQDKSAIVQETGNSKTLVMSQKAVSEMGKNLNNRNAILDVSRVYPNGGSDGGEYYTLKGAIAITPSDIRKNIKYLTFKTSEDKRELWQFDGIDNDSVSQYDAESKWHLVDPDMFWELEFDTASDLAAAQNNTRVKVPGYARKKGMIIRYVTTAGEEYIEIYTGESGNISGPNYYNNFRRLISYQNVFDLVKHEGVFGSDCLFIKEVYIDKFKEGATYKFREGVFNNNYPNGYFNVIETLNGVTTNAYIRATIDDNGISQLESTSLNFHAYIIFDLSLWNQLQNPQGFQSRDVNFNDNAKNITFSPTIFSFLKVNELDSELRPMAEVGAGLKEALYAQQSIVYENLEEQAGNEYYTYNNIGLIHKAEKTETFNTIKLAFGISGTTTNTTGNLIVKVGNTITASSGRIIKQIDNINNVETFPTNGSGLFTIELDSTVTLQEGEYLWVYFTQWVSMRVWSAALEDGIRCGMYFQGKEYSYKYSTAMTLFIREGDLVNINNRIEQIEDELGIEGGGEASFKEPLVAFVDDLYVPVGVKQKFYYNEFIYGDESTMDNTLNWRVQTRISPSTIGIKCVADEEGFVIYSHTAGDYTATVTIYDSMKNQKWQGSVNIHVFAPQSVALSSNKSILMLGASWIDINSGNKGYTPYINDALKEIGINLNFVGTRDAGTSGLKHEGIGGYGYITFTSAPSVVRFKFYFDSEPSISKDDVYSNNGSTYQLFEKGSGYITMSRISGSTEPSGNVLTRTSGTGDSTIQFTSWTLGGSNPLWNTTTNKLDFTHYRRDLCGLSTALDFCNIQLGVNDCLGSLKTTKVDWKPYLDAAKTLFDAILADSPNCKIIVGLGAMGAPGTTGWSALFGLSSGDKRTFQVNSYYLRTFLNEEIRNRADYKTNVFIGQSLLGINRWYGYLHYDAREIYCRVNLTSSEQAQLESYNFQNSNPFARIKDSEGKTILGNVNIVRYDRRGYLVLKKWTGNWDTYDQEFISKNNELVPSGTIELHKNTDGMPTTMSFTECNQIDDNLAEHSFVNATHPADYGYRQMAYCAAWEVAYLSLN